MFSPNDFSFCESCARLEGKYFYYLFYFTIRIIITADDGFFFCTVHTIAKVIINNLTFHQIAA